MNRIRRCARGAATIEFQIVSLLVLIPLVMALLQMGLFIVAKNTVNLATFHAARAGAASGADRAEIRHALGVGLAPLYVSGAKGWLRLGLADISPANYPGVMGAALLMAHADLKIPLVHEIRILNPTIASFADFGVNQAPGKRTIPVTNVMDDHKVGGTSQQTRADALLLKIQVEYCYRMVFPLIDKAITGILRFTTADLGKQACYARNGVPIAAQAVVRMTVPPVQANLSK